VTTTTTTNKLTNKKTEQKTNKQTNGKKEQAKKKKAKHNPSVVAEYAPEKWRIEGSRLGAPER
jgi:carbohydrate-binding DOMON domain-containing protein